MVSFSPTDIVVITLFFFSVITAGSLAGFNAKKDAEGFLLSGRNVGLILFILTNVATWYGGILGVGEFVYRYGILSWVTQGLPYYIFAFLFAIFFAKKIRNSSLITIPDKLILSYNEQISKLSAVLVFVLVSPAPYLLMIGNLLSLIFGIQLWLSLIIAFLLSAAYLFKGGFKSNIYADAVLFYFMFAGFILILVFALNNFGGLSFLQDKLPKEHLTFWGNVSPGFIVVWFLIAMWTFADPGFHQRCYAAKSGSVAVKGIIISIFFWFLFDALTTLTGLFARASMPELSNPTLSFPLLAEIVLPSGLKGIFYAALFATIISTANSFLFLSATTISRDFIYRFSSKPDESKLKTFSIFGLIISGALSVLLAYFIPSVIEIWYTIGSICIPGIILPVISAYYPKLKINSKLLSVEMIVSVMMGFLWLFIRSDFQETFLFDIEPMIVGLLFSTLIHSAGLVHKSFSLNEG